MGKIYFPNLGYYLYLIATIDDHSRFCLKNHVKALGLKYHYIHKNTPNENALIERSFRTDEEEFFFRLDKAPQHYDELREWFANYLHEYNYIRPHLGIDLKTPYEVIANVLSG